jgi:transposase
MSLHPQPIPPVLEETARVARTAFPHGNLYLMMRDELGTLFSDDDFAALFPTRGQSAEAPWRLALVTIMQYVGSAPDVLLILDKQMISRSFKRSGNMSVTPPLRPTV